MTGILTKRGLFAHNYRKFGHNHTATEAEIEVITSMSQEMLEAGKR